MECVYRFVSTAVCLAVLFPAITVVAASKNTHANEGPEGKSFEEDNEFLANNPWLWGIIVPLGLGGVYLKYRMTHRSSPQGAEGGGGSRLAIGRNETAPAQNDY